MDNPQDILVLDNDLKFLMDILAEVDIDVRYLYRWTDDKWKCDPLVATIKNWPNMRLLIISADKAAHLGVNIIIKLLQWLESHRPAIKILMVYEEKEALVRWDRRFKICRNKYNTTMVSLNQFKNQCGQLKTKPHEVDIPF